MSAVFATQKDTEASRLGMLPSLLGRRPVQPDGGAKQEQRSGKVQPQVPSDAALPDAPPGLPPTPKGEAIRKAMPADDHVEQPEKAEEESDEESTSGDDDLDDEETAKIRLAKAETAEKTADGLPSVGSALHASGQCSRCCFFLKNRCQNGVDCQFCHLEHERRSRGRGCRGRGTGSKEAKVEAAALGAAQAQQQQQPPTPQSHGPKVPTTPQQQWPKSMLFESQEPRPTLLPLPPGLGCSAPPGLASPDAIKPLSLMSLLSTAPTGRAPPPSSAPMLWSLLPGPPSSAPPPFAAPNGLPEQRGEEPPPPPDYADASLRSASGVRPAPGLTLSEEGRSQVTASQLLLSTFAPPTNAPRLSSVEGLSFASLDGNVTWGQGFQAGNSFRPTAGPVTVAQCPTPTASAVAAVTVASVIGGSSAGGAILGTTPMPGGAMMPWIPGVPRHLCMQPGMLQQPVVMLPRTPTGTHPPTPARGLQLTAPPVTAPPPSAPATPAAWAGMHRSMAATLAEAAEELPRPQTDDIFDLAALNSAIKQAEAVSGNRPLKISVPELGEAAPLDPRLPAKKRLPEWTF